MKEITTEKRAVVEQEATTTRSSIVYRFAASAFFAAAIFLAFAALTYQIPWQTKPLANDHVMTDEVQAVKVGKMVWGQPKPTGGLPELSEQIGKGDLKAAVATIDGLRAQFKPVLREIEFRAEKKGDRSIIKPALLFERNLADIKKSLIAGDKDLAASQAGKAFGLWAGVEGVLGQATIDSSALGRRLLLFLAAWIALTVLIVAAAKKPQVKLLKTAAGDYDIPADHRGGINLMRFRVIKALLSSPVFPAALQAFSLLFLVISITLGLTGPTSSSENFASVIYWSLWWSPVMMLSLVLFGRLWCGVCPVGALTAIIEPFGARLKSPNFAKKASFGLLAVTPLTISVIGFILMREPLWGTSYAITQSPVRTSLFIGVWIMAAVAVSLLYERRAWCRYWCPVTAACSVISDLAPVDFVHGKSSGVADCSTKEYGGQYLTSDKRCIYCLKCTQSHVEAPVYARLRLPGSALIGEKRLFAEAAMSLILVAVFPIGHGLGQLPFFQSAALSEYRAGYFAAIVLSLAAFSLVSKVGGTLVKTGFSENFARFGGAYAPLGVLFSVGMAITGILKGAGNWLNVTAPLFGVFKHWSPALADRLVIQGWQQWSMSWMTAIGGAWALALIIAIGRRHKIPAIGWAPHTLLVVAFVIAAKLLPMPMH